MSPIPNPQFPTPNPQSPLRLVVVGTSGSGKTTLAAQIAAILAIPHVEIDALHWGPNWTETPKDELQAKILAAIAGPAWVVDGNYSKVRPVLWPRATTIVWLDYSLPVLIWRILRRTLGRVFLRQELWSGNRERFFQAFFSRDSIIYWVLTTYKRRRVEYPELFAQPDNAHLTVIRHRSPGETKAWLDELSRRAQVVTRPTQPVLALRLTDNNQ